jgi:lysophospholipase L1-like esterase
VAQARALRVLFLGDSVTWGGTSLDDAQIFPEVAAGVLRSRGLEVYAMNAGVNGTALCNHAEVFHRTSGPVDVVVWLFPWGDVTRNFATVGLLVPARFQPRFALVEAVDHAIIRFWVGAFRLRQTDARPFQVPDYPLGREAWFARVLVERKARNLDAARRVVAEAGRRGLPLILGVTPYRSGNRLEPLPQEAVAFLEEMARLGAAVLDVAAVMEQAPHPAGALYLDHVHLNAHGHRVVGAALAELLDARLGGRDHGAVDQQCTSAPPVFEIDVLTGQEGIHANRDPPRFHGQELERVAVRGGGGLEGQAQQQPRRIGDPGLGAE